MVRKFVPTFTTRLWRFVGTCFILLYHVDQQSYCWSFLERLTNFIVGMHEGLDATVSPVPVWDDKDWVGIRLSTNCARLCARMYIMPTIGDSSIDGESNITL